MSDSFRYTPKTVSTIRQHARTMAPGTIATIMCCPTGTIEQICRKHGITMRDRDGVDLEAPLKAKVVKKEIGVEIDAALMRVVAKEARTRRIFTNTLIEQLIEKIAADGLFGAVLDR